MKAVSIALKMGLIYGALNNYVDQILLYVREYAYIGGGSKKNENVLI